MRYKGRTPNTTSITIPADVLYGVAVSSSM